MKQTFTIVALLVLLGVSLAAAGTVGKMSGRITDRSTGEAVVGANVVVGGTTLGQATDADGSFVIINIPPGT
jgi:hypothetical protein